VVVASYEQLCMDGFASEFVIQTMNNTYRLEEVGVINDKTKAEDM